MPVFSFSMTTRRAYSQIGNHNSKVTLMGVSYSSESVAALSVETEVRDGNY